jgi:hypothetical protein
VSVTLPRGVSQGVLRRLTPEPERPLPVDPVRWVQDELDEFVWSMQAEIMGTVVRERKTAVQSCHGIGKSYTASRLGAWWIAGHPPGEAMIVTTAPSGNQVRVILWGEISKAHRRGHLAGRVVTGGQVPEWSVDGQIVGFGRKPTDYIDVNQAMTQFQGIHARYLLVIVDEACGIPKWLWDALETLITNEASRILAIGNPDDPTSEFARKCQPGSGWANIQIGVEDTPAWTGEYVPEQLRESLVSRMWADDRIRDWGADSAMVTSKVHGQFPEIADDVIITPRMIRQAYDRDLSGRAIADAGRFGMDVARLGEDETVIYRNRGGMIRVEDAWHKHDTDWSRKRTQALLERDPYRPMLIDVVGLGAGVHDPLAAQGFKVQAFSGGEKANRPDRYVNRNAEAWWAFREGLEAGLIDLDESDQELAAQLQNRRWTEDAAGKRIEIEGKKAMAKRGLKSPDRADAAILSWYEGVHTVDSAAAIMPGPGEVTSITGDLLHMKT